MWSCAPIGALPTSVSRSRHAAVMCVRHTVARDWTPLRRRREPHQGARHGPAPPHHLRGTGGRRLARADLARDHPRGPRPRPGRPKAVEDGAELVFACGGDGTVMAWSPRWPAPTWRWRCCRPAPATCSPPTSGWPATRPPASQVALEGGRKRIDVGVGRGPVLRGDGRDGLRRADARGHLRDGEEADRLAGVRRRRRQAPAGPADAGPDRAGRRPADAPPPAHRDRRQRRAGCRAAYGCSARPSRTTASSTWPS